MMDNRNMILAIVLSIAILVGFEAYFNMMAPAPDPQAIAMQQAAIANGTAPDAASSLPTVDGTGQTTELPSPEMGTVSGAAIESANRDEILASATRILIRTPRVDGSISLVGGIIDDLSLRNYREELDPNSAEIVVLLPKGLKNAYYADFGWIAGTDTPDMAMPTPETVWTANASVLTPSKPVTLSWDNGAGLIFKKTISIDDNYMFSVYQRVENTGGTTVSVHSYGLVSRRTTPDVTGFFILHEGLLGVFDETLTEVDYDDLQEAGAIEQSSTGGWIGITDKYWLTALVPGQDQAVNTRFVHRKDQDADRYQIDYLSGTQVIPAGGTAQYESHFFAGAKEVPLLDGYAEEFGVDRFDLAIDFGWFYFLTKPIFQALLWLNSHVGNLGVSILLLTVAIKAAFFPLANKSYVAMSKMKKLQPEMKKLRERFGDDKVQLNQEMMALYKREKANPAAGCLPVIIQIPVFFSLYKVLFVTIEMRHAPFFGWIQDLSAPDPTTIFNLFGLIPWGPPDFLMIGIWPLIMGISMFLQQKLNPQPADPIQAKIFLFMPIMFTFLLARFPAGLVVYWAWNNSLSILQQWIIMRRMGVKV
ncbi:MAG: membrane protein insertase YidC [Rhodospirillales bacterium]|nr:membrane protein insertase YidC [Rhodospirillales bacterium]